jgi:hypothetical protein
MWPMLSSGDRVRVWIRGRRPRPVMVLAIGERGELELAIPPVSARGTWRPLHVEQQQVRGIFEATIVRIERGGMDARLLWEVPA